VVRPASEDRGVGPALAALASRYGLTGHQEGQLGQLLAVLEFDPQAPTTVRAGVAALNVHVADSLVALELGLVRDAQRIADLGAGAGFPGIVLAVALPESEVRLVESQARKCAFMARLIAEAGIHNAQVVNARAEDWPQGALLHDLVTARAVGPQELVLEYAAPLMAPSGRLVDWRGRHDRDGEAIALAAAKELGLHRLEVRPVDPFVGARDLHLHLFAKVSATPARFPRRTGIARKRPLGR
jgi:16S rRNA (guanine527-N7)-methyltransferase